MISIPDHPDIRACERTGYPSYYREDEPDEEEIEEEEAEQEPEHDDELLYMTERLEVCTIRLNEIRAEKQRLSVEEKALSAKVKHLRDYITVCTKYSRVNFAYGNDDYRSEQAEIGRYKQMSERVRQEDRYDDI